MHEDFAFVGKDDRCQVRDSGQDRKQPLLLRRVEVSLPLYIRAWADEAHVALQDVDQLSELVELIAPHQPADARNSRIVGGGGVNSRFIGTDTHRTELYDRERFTCPPDAWGQVKWIAKILEKDQKTEDQKYRRYEDQNNKARNEIENTFHVNTRR